MRSLSVLLRLLCAAVLTVGSFAVGHGGSARAAGYETLLVPSAAMGLDIPVAFLAGGPHAVYLLDAFNAAPDVSNWVTAGNAMNTLAGKGISVAAPAGGAFSMYTNWGRGGSKQGATFLSTERPDCLGPPRGGPARWRWPASTPTASASPVRCRDSCTRRTPPPTARSSRACSSSAGSTATVCGEPRSWVGGSGTTRRCMQCCWRRTTRGYGSGAR